ncbi:DUF1638 domain-containing protein [Methylomonas sp. SURF-1]|uniref:DUF1638 domain-containing protein n=1 Tax=Methylomonas aurea TaxID=2952224 RepID=A0ABT1UF24_9GAMM|nr:DUF1638 domain-containing protein [Methylomonas sp. SURF-1]MCQ8180760.1 DUF1638 domain-containing protein [Methylomonas sp. SURF-1]
MKAFTLKPEPQPTLTLVGCGILRKEVDRLIEKNHWTVHTHYLDSALHNYLNRLATELNQALEEREKLGEKTVVFYGSCHPLMESYLEAHHTCRTQGQNCIVMLLGYERFMQELENGAYFLLEDWALTWEPMITACFGNNSTVVREIFHSSHKYILALRTPCNGDFTRAAEAAARFVDLPLRWQDVDLDHLESVLADAIQRRSASEL